MSKTSATPPSNVLDRVLVMEMVRVTEAAAVAASALIGRGDEKAADAAAVEAMRKAFDELPIDGTVVIGEGERDEAPMLYIGEKVGGAQGTGPKIDIALDPLEGTTITAKAGPNALAVLAAAALGCVGGQFNGRLVFRNEDERARARKWGIEDLNKIYTRDELAKGDCIFAATGVTDGSMLKGVKRHKSGVMTTDSVVMRASSGTVRWVRGEHRTRR